MQIFNNQKELEEIIQSSHINFLFGAGSSHPFLPLLGNIETEINNAKSEEQKILKYKEYLENVMLPNKKIVNGQSIDDDKYKNVTDAYDNFFKKLSNTILSRKSTILSKQVNLFTTNIDILMETSLERLSFEYNDGFSGRFNPKFSIANYKKSIYQRSLHFDHISEIPVFNIIKMHGSLTWQENNSEITFSHNLEHFNDELLSKNGSDFINDYKKILVVNPSEEKHLETVLNLYYSELLRMYSSELERENATLFVIGFSMEDKHIKEITLRAANANPTLRIFICCSQKSEPKMYRKMDIMQHPNIQTLTPENKDDKYTLDYFSNQILTKIKQNDDTESI